MASWRQTRPRVSRRDINAGALAAGAAMVVAPLCFPGLWVLDALYAELTRTAELYLFGYVGFIFYAVVLAALVALVAGTMIWRWMVPLSRRIRGGGRSQVSPRHS